MEQANLKKAAYIALGALAVLLAGSVIFYKERMLLCDDAHIAFHIINYGTLQIQQLRFGAFITQCVPLLLAKMHLPLKTILIGYSLSFNLFYFIVACMLVFRFRAYALAVLMAFYFTLIASDTYYWTNNEIHQGIAWMFLCFGYIFSPGRQRNFVSVIIVLLLVGGLAVITHPLVIVPFVFLAAFLCMDASLCPFTKNQTIILAIITLALFAIRIIISSQGADYDKRMVDKITAPSMEMAVDLLKNTVKNYWLLPFLFIAGLVTMLKQKKYLPATWVSVFCIGYFIAITMTFKGYLAFYTESELMPAIIFITTPFVFLILPRMKAQQVVLLIGFIFLVRLCYIVVASGEFSDRLTAINRTLFWMQRNNISKQVLLKEGDKIDPLWMLEWGMPAETFLASALNGDKPQRQFLILHKDQAWEIPAGNKEMIMTGHNVQASGLNTFYFTVDTTQPYSVKEIGY
jgi:hypothetical protein